jgi:hypothetical protein
LQCTTLFLHILSHDGCRVRVGGSFDDQVLTSSQDFRWFSFFGLPSPKLVTYLLPSCWLLNYRQKVTWFTHDILLSIFIISTFMHDLMIEEYSIIINYRSMTCNVILSNFPSWHNDRLYLDFLYSNIFSLFYLLCQF